jgi:hypothetical protein
MKFSTVLVLFALCAIFASAERKCFGCPKVVPIDHPAVQAAASYAVKELSHSADKFKMMSAAVQVVNGLNYHLVFETQQGSQLDVFKTVVYKKTSMEETVAVLAFDALISRKSAVSCAGCVRDIAVDDVNVAKAAQFAWLELEKIEADVDMNIGSNFRVHAAGVQIVNGVNYYLHLEGQFGEVQVQHTATIYRDFSQQHYLTRSSFFKALIAV